MINIIAVWEKTRIVKSTNSKLFFPPFQIHPFLPLVFPPLQTFESNNPSTKQLLKGLKVAKHSQLTIKHPLHDHLRSGKINGIGVGEDIAKLKQSIICSWHA